jgi:hypothetical protein
MEEKTLYQTLNFRFKVIVGLVALVAVFGCSFSIDLTSTPIPPEPTHTPTPTDTPVPVDTPLLPSAEESPTLPSPPTPTHTHTPLATPPPPKTPTLPPPPTPTLPLPPTATPSLPPPPTPTPTPLATPRPTYTPTPSLSAGMEPDTDRVGMDYKDFDLPQPNPELCRSACFKDAKCMAYTYVKPGIQGQSARCWLKSGVPPPKPNKCCISGVKPVKSLTPTPDRR